MKPSTRSELIDCVLLVPYAFGLVMLAFSRDGKHAWREWWQSRWPDVVAEVDRREHAARLDRRRRKGTP